MMIGSAIDGWVLVSLLRSMDGVCEQYKVHHEDGRDGVLSLYEMGSEPDTQVYAVLESISRLHTPQIMATGRWQERAYEVIEPLSGETLADLGVVLKSLPELCSVVAELGGALYAFAEAGLRHRGISPEVLLVRAHEPLDLVVSGFGSACLSEYDMEVVSTLNLSVYMAPEAVMGAVSAASDWWSLGMVLLEQLTEGACFKGQDAYTFLLQTLTDGVEIPTHLNAPLQQLIKGLLTHDYEKRWQWAEVTAWLESVPEALLTAGTVLGQHMQNDVPPVHDSTNATNSEQIPIEIGRRTFYKPAAFALAAACQANWVRGLELFEQGAITEWVKSLGRHESQLDQLMRITETEKLSADMRLMLALKVLNPKMPLVYGGKLVTPLWLLENPDYGYTLIRLVAPFLQEMGAQEEQRWYIRLHKRIKHIRRRAASLHIKLDEKRLREHLLCTSHAQLVARAHKHYLAYPDAENAGVLSLMERRNLGNEDLILLLSAQESQFAPAPEVLKAVETLVEACGLYFDTELAQEYITLPRIELYTMLDERVQGMAVTGHAQIDSWIEQYRLEKRMPMERLLVLLMYPKEQWLLPQKHQYMLSLLDYFEKKVAFSGLIGPLVRMRIGRYTPRVDLTEQSSSDSIIERQLNHLLERKGDAVYLSFSTQNWEAYSRISSLEREADLYKRDTGIDGLYMGFPFLLYQEPRSYRLPRIAPIFLWPVKLKKGLAQQGNSQKMSLAFDREREEVRINPALENILGKATAQKWAEILNELMRRSTLSVGEVMESFSDAGNVRRMDVPVALPVDFEVEVGKPEFVPSAVLFMVNFTGQAVGEDLRNLKGLPLAGSSLERLLRLDEEAPVGDVEAVLPPEDERYLVMGSDPSQEKAVLQAREAPGLLIEGPPGTGKSQTIVNLVADSLGRGQTMLIVCQKKAALDVVYKRLVAEGLASRIMMVGDINADRYAVIRSIREQLAQLRRQGEPVSVLNMQRELLGQRITELERGLDDYHEGLHAVDVQTGLSYRQIVTDLIRISTKGATLSLPMLQPLVSELSQKSLSALEAEVGAVLPQWLAAYYEGSPFQHLRLFANDATAAGIFKRALQVFLNTGHDVVRTSQERPTSVQVKSDPQVFREWMSAYMDELLQLSGEPRQQLIRWLPLFQTVLPGAKPELAAQTVGSDLLEKFRHLLHLLKQAPLDHWQERYSQQIAGLDDVWLANLEKQVCVMAAPRPWYAFLSIRRRQYQSNIVKQLQSWGISVAGQSSLQPEFVALRDALHLERQWRPLRQELQHICNALKVFVPAKDSGPELLVYAQNCFNALKEVARWAEVISEFPDHKALTVVFRSGDADALQRLRMEYEIAFVHYALRQKWLLALEALTPYFSDYLLEECRYAIRHYIEIPVVIAQMKEELPRLNAYLAFRDKAPHLSLLAQELLASLQTSRDYLQSVSVVGLSAEFCRALRKEALLVWKTRIEQAFPSLLQSRAVWEKSIEELEKADIQMRQLNRDLLVRENLNKIASGAQWENITRLRGGRALRLREFIEQGEKLGLMQLRPVWLLNPDVASRLMPLKAGLFDTVVYDEASQMSVEFALPTLFRGKRVVVSGDEKQMPPSSFFTAQVEMDEEDMLVADVVHGNIGDDDWDEVQSEWNRREIQDCPDLLQLARTVLPGTTLQIHYRSAYRELIAFSNAAFYTNQLNVPVRHPEKEVFKAKPIELIQVNGVYHEQKNEAEAKRVVTLLAELWKKPMHERPSVGVATFNKKQASLIEQMLYQRSIKNAAFRKELAQERQRFEAGEDMSVFVKNVENVQGDERDIIIFSTTFGYNRDGVFRRNFGVLGQQGGERRLNVGITRARQKVILVSSIPIDAVSDMLTTQRAPRIPRDYLQGYLEYARLLSCAEMGAAQQLLKRMELAHGLAGMGMIQATDGLREQVDAYLTELGVRYQSASGEDAFYLDFVIEDPRTGLYVLGVECDAPCHPLLSGARAREIWRPSVLKRVIPKIHRIASPHWFQNTMLEKERLKEALEEVLSADN